MCSVFRDVAEPTFGENERRRLYLLVPHLSRAFGVTYRLRDAEFRLATTLSALDRIHTGILLLDDRGAVVHSNAAARRSLQQADGLSLRIANGKTGDRLHAKEPQEQQLIHEALCACTAADALDVPHFSRGVHVRRPSGARDFVLQFAPLPANHEFGLGHQTSRVIVFLNDAEAPLSLDAALLKRLYGLTAAEILFAERLVAGETAIEAAVSRGISEATARTHLHRIFEKTSTCRQAELVKLLLSLHAIH